MRERVEQRHPALLIADDVPAVAFSSLSLLEPTAPPCPQGVQFKKALPSPCLESPALSPDRIQSSLWPGGQGPSYPDPSWLHVSLPPPSRPFVLPSSGPASFCRPLHCSLAPISSPGAQSLAVTQGCLLVATR